MNWNNLKYGFCPKCEKKLVMGLLDSVYKCSDENLCGFSISKEKFEGIAYGNNKRTCYVINSDNLSELNNLGHEVVTDDFSDSPHKDRDS